MLADRAEHDSFDQPNSLNDLPTRNIRVFVKTVVLRGLPLGIVFAIACSEFHSGVSSATSWPDILVPSRMFNFPETLTPHAIGAAKVALYASSRNHESARS